MIDYGARKTDLAVKRTEWRLSRVYRQAERDIAEKMEAWQKRHAAREKLYRQQLKEGKITQADFDAWMRGQVFQGKQWQARKEQIQAVLLNADKSAAKIVNDGKLGVFVDNANYIGYGLEHDANINTGFMLYDEQTVARLIKSDPQILPKPAPGVKKDKAYPYYNKLVNGAITQGIVQGEDIRQIAKRIARETGERSYSSAVRNARTAFTGAQNAGRIEGLHQAQRLGINVKKKWLATLDGRTRDSHRKLDGQIQEVDDPFISELGKIRFPGDPTANGGDVYNCRCTLTYVYPEYPSEMQRRDNETGEIVGDMTYEEWEKWKREKTIPSFDDWIKKRKDSDFARDYQSRRDMGELLNEFKIENPIISKREITDFYQYANETNGIWTTTDSDGTPVDHMTEKTKDALDKLIESLTGRIYDTDEDAERDYVELRQFLNNTPLFISKYDRANIPDFEAYRRSKNNFIRTTYDRNATSIDEIFDDLVESYPGRFDVDAKDVTSKLQAINNGMSQLDYDRKIPVRDGMLAEDYKDMQDDVRLWLLAIYDAVKSR